MSRWKTTKRISRRICATCSIDFTEAAIARCRVCGRTSPRGMGKRDLLASPRSKSLSATGQRVTEMRLWFHHQLSTPVGEMWHVLNAKLRGHYQYYGINDNWPLLMAYRSKVRRMAKRHLSRRSQKSYVNWGDFNRFTELHPLASPTRLTDLIAMNRQLLSAGDK